MEMKFFLRDVIGKKPKKVGDTFKAQYFGAVHRFRATKYTQRGDTVEIFAVMEA